MAVAAAPQLYFDEKWKLSKKEGRGPSSSSTSSFMRSCSTSSTTFMRSCSSSSPTFMRSSSTSSSSSSSSRGRSSFTRKCASLVKEQRARFYIMRRCVTMLVCWRDYRES